MSWLNTIRRKVFVNIAMAQPCDLSGQTFVVTGASEGSLGFATATTLLQWGASVIVTKRKHSEQLYPVLLPYCQDTSSSTQAQLICLDLDLCDRASVDAFCQRVHEQTLALNGLINNAGIHLDLMSAWQTPQLSHDGHEIHWRTNGLGTAHLTLGLLPLLQRAGETCGDARIVNVVSALHHKGVNRDFFEPPATYNSWQAYGQSKLALVHMTQALADQYQGCGLSSYCLHPGAVMTKVADKGLAGHRWLEAIRRVLAPVERFFLCTPEEGAQTQIHLATADLALLQNGAYYCNSRVAPRSAEAGDKAVSKRLWQTLTLWVQNG